MCKKYLGLTCKLKNTMRNIKGRIFNSSLNRMLNKLKKSRCINDAGSRTTIPIINGTIKDATAARNMSPSMPNFK